MWNFNNILEGPKPNTNLGLRHAKTLTLDGYWDVLNTRPLGGERVPFLIIVIVS
jgi:hypothetical protein